MAAEGDEVVGPSVMLDGQKDKLSFGLGALGSGLALVIYDEAMCL